MKPFISKFLMVPAVLLLLTLIGCGSGDGQGTSVSANGSQQVALTAEDIAAAQAIDKEVQALSASTAPVAGQVKVFGAKTYVVPKAGNASFTNFFNGIVDGALGTLVVKNSTGKDIPTDACVGTPREIARCEKVRNELLAKNPTSIEIALNGQVVVAPGQIQRTQGVANIPVTVNALNEITVNLAGPPKSYIQLAVWSATTPQELNPVAEFTMTPTTGPNPLLVFFNASASSTPNGTIVNYAWEFGDGLTGTGVLTDHFYEVPGTYAVVLTVTDSSAKTATKSATIVVTENILPIASFTYYIDAINAPLTLNVDASSSYDSDGSIQFILWAWGDGSPISTGVTSSHTYPVGGTYSVQLNVEDNSGYSASTSQTITIPPIALP